MGTPIYMAPELLSGKPYDRGADVWGAHRRSNCVVDAADVRIRRLC